MRRVSKVKRLRSCGRHPFGEDGVGLHRVEGDGGTRGAVTGVVTCSSVSCCPVCSAHIRVERASEIGRAAGSHLDAGGGLLFAVLTLRHHRGERLGDLMDGLQGAIRRLTMGTPWQRARDRYGILGLRVDREVTWGGDNGWHPHANVLIFLERPLGVGELDQLVAWLKDRWRTMVLREGLREPTLRRGCEVQVVSDGEGIGVYAAKVQERDSVALEMTWVEAKRSATGLLPFDLLEAAGDGETWAVDLWHEYEDAMDGRRIGTWSRGLRERLGLGEELSDEDITAEHETSEDTEVMRVGGGEWRRVCDAGLEVDVLQALAHPDGVEAARRAVESLILRARDRTMPGARPRREVMRR